MSDLKSENEIFDKKPVIQSHIASKSSSKYFLINSYIFKHFLLI